jgi:hypothetical protein
MTTIVTELRNAGVRLTIENGKIKATGDKAALARWMPVLRERRAEIVEALKVGAGDTARSRALTAEDEAVIRRWLALIGETDPATIAAVIEQCASDAAARAYFIRRAAEEPPAAKMTDVYHAAAQQNAKQKSVQD